MLARRSFRTIVKLSELARRALYGGLSVSSCPLGGVKNSLLLLLQGLRPVSDEWNDPPEDRPGLMHEFDKLSDGVVVRVCRDWE